jgi:hypothetical protein
MKLYISEKFLEEAQKEFANLGIEAKEIFGYAYQDKEYKLLPDVIKYIWRKL